MATLVGDAGNNTLTGTSGNDSLSGLGGDDSLSGGDGFDTLDGGTGNDTLDGGLSENIASYSADSAGITADLSAGTATGSAIGSDVLLNIHRVTGGSGSDSLVGNSGANTLTGNSGNDTFFGGGAHDAINGGGGFDTAVFTGAISDYTFFNSLLGIGVIDNRPGSPDGADTFTGVETFQFSDGNLFDSQISAPGFAQPYFLVVGHTDGDPANANDKYFSGGVREWVLALGGNDTVLNVSGGEVVYAGDGNDSIDGITNNNQIFGEAGNDTVSAYHNSYGLSGPANIIDGGSGDDSFAGVSFDDTTFGSQSTDTLTGGSGSEIFELVADPSRTFVPDIIADFQAGAGGDIIDIFNLPVGDPFALGYARLLQSGSDVLLQLDGDAGGGTYTWATALVLQNTNAATFTASNFATPSTFHAPGTTGLSPTGDGAANTLAGSADNDTLSGNGGDDSLSALAGSDMLFGGSGNDTLDGGAGADILIGGTGNDTYIVDDASEFPVELPGEGFDTVNTTLNYYELPTNVENLSYTGAKTFPDSNDFLGAGNALANSITGGAGNDTLGGGDGSDTLDGGPGADKLVGGTGDDLYIVDNASDSPTENPGEGTDAITTVLAAFTLPSNVETLTYTGASTFNGTGNGADNQITGGPGNDSLVGSGGSDTIDGGLGSDTLVGGPGDDTYVVDTPFDSVLENPGEGNDTVRVTAPSYGLSANVENLIYVGVGNFRGSGSLADNQIVGSSGDDTLTGGPGNDTLNGGAGTDKLAVDFSLFSQPVSLSNFNAPNGSGTIGNGVIQTTFLNIENFDITLGNGSDFFDISSSAYDARLVRGFGPGDGDDTILTGSGNDTVVDIYGNDSVASGAGNDSIDTHYDNDTVLAGAGDDTLYDVYGTNSLDAGSGNDLILHVSYNIESLPAGVNTIWGGTGTDRFVLDLDLSLAQVPDTIMDFQPGAGGDVIDFTNLVGGLIGFTSGSDPFAAGYFRLLQNGPDTLLQVDRDGSSGGASFATVLIMKNATAASFSTDNFVGINDGPNTILGTTGNDTLSGFGGNDSLYGQDGNDCLSGGADNDSLEGYSGFDTLVGGDGNDTLHGDYSEIAFPAGSGADSLSGDAGNDLLFGDQGNDTLLGGAGNDTLNGDTQNDSIDGGDGNDLISGDYESTFLGGFSDTVLGGAGADTIFVDGGADLIDGGDGDDVFEQVSINNAHAGADTITGGAGIDTYVLSAVFGAPQVPDVVTDFQTGAGADILNIASLISGLTGYVASSNPFLAGYMRLVQSSVDTLFQVDSDASANGASFATVLTLKGTTATAFGPANFQAPYGFDPWVGAGNDTFVGNGGANTIFGYGGDDSLLGGAGDDSLDGGDGNDTLEGGAENDTLAGGSGTDLADFRSDSAGVNVNLAAGTAAGSATGNDVLSEIENVSAGSGADTLTGDANANSLVGADGSDSLAGNGGNDFLSGGAGNDTLDGGAGIDTASFSGSLAAYSITRGAGQVTVSGPDGIDSLTGIERLLFSDGTITVRPPDTDFNADGMSDILWRNDDSGAVSVWEMNGTSLQYGKVIPGAEAIAQSWHIAGTGDFDADGLSDILWRNDNGAVAIWEMNGTSLRNGAVVPGAEAISQSWHIAGTGDFNADGMSDILWRNDNGAVAIWEMNGTSLRNGAVVPGAEAIPQSWHIASTGDFNADGMSDILWRNDNGAVAIWEMNGTSLQNGAVVPGAEAISQSWHIAGTGDFNADGMSDILWRNDNGAVAIWEMNGTSLLYGAVVPGAEAIAQSWHIAGTGDFNADGMSDILWRNDNGAVAIWEMNGTSLQNGAVVPGAEAISQSWHIQDYGLLLS